MIRVLTHRDFKTMPWANGRGQTVEMARLDDAAGMVWRFSRAAVVEEGEFSLFPGIDRNLTVLNGAGFDLIGPGVIHATPLQPVAFAGDVAIRAVNVTGPCEDFNVMVRRGTACRVQVMDGGVATGGAIFALGPVQVGAYQMGRYDLLLTDEAVAFQGQAIVVDLAL